MLSMMQVRRTASVGGISGLVIWAWVVWLSPVTEAAVFYSWIDSSGTVVMTDDPTHVPLLEERSAGRVHRFLDEAAAPSRVEDSVGGSDRSDRAMSMESPTVSRTASEEPQRTREPSPVDPAELALPTVVLEPPDDAVKGKYTWVPFKTPLLFGLKPVHGFWWHPGSLTPLEAFNRFLTRHSERALGRLRGTGLVVSGHLSSGISGIRSGNPVYDQVLRERHALIQRQFSRFRVGARAPWSRDSRADRLLRTGGAPPHRKSSGVRSLLP